MRISTRLKLAGPLSVGFVAVIAAVPLSTTQQVRRELTKNEVAAEVLKGATALRYLTLEYVLHHDERAQAQWRLRHASLSKLLTNTTEFTGTEEQAIVDGLRHTHESVNTLFTQLVANHPNRENDRENSAVLEELETRLTGQITNKTQTMISDAQGLSERSRVGVLEHQQRASFAVVSFGGIVVLVIAATLFLTLRSVTRPLAKLRDGTAIVGAGNLDFRLDVTARDEIGELSRAFDEMTGRLKGTIAERKRAEEALRESEQSLAIRVRQRTAELEAANKELEAFSYSVSHDLRAPLRAIDGFSSIVLRDHATALPAEGQRHLGLVREGAQQMARLIDDLLSFAKTARQPIARRTVALKELVNQCLEEFRGEIAERKAEVAVGNLPECRADAALLKQVLTNLLGNAVKYTRKQPRAKIEVGCRSENGEQAIFVRDNGVGFDMKHAGKLFGVFQRLHHNEDFEGTGVGLAIVQRVVHRHGGRVWAEAELDKGAIFYFTLGKDQR
jgi:signal transduction histidine kinase